MSSHNAILEAKIAEHHQDYQSLVAANSVVLTEAKLESERVMEHSRVQASRECEAQQLQLTKEIDGHQETKKQMVMH